ncbi:T9SS type A sorting domain-containing protein [Brumimicrobium aurantiacum]|uniref:T9SS C-terminal target domain-containing protein n=1 Tax=Brumimicrobium aurantiacum TaxID=1737063 RepID=A0A3E1EZP5_9FLAO|nr:T9SS type A sorting domain-containing protein [Brumimicrobium aurantiacum]RFC54953.1 T9SS C-terminal target domain-containing protein [Brumimicrobium aurantiacum]
MRIPVFIFTFLTSISLWSQDYNKSNFSIKKSNTISEFKGQGPFQEKVNNLEMPSPGGTSAKSYLLRQKQKSKNFYKNYKGVGQASFLKSTAQPIVGDSMVPKRWYNGTQYPVYGGIPSDNTLAVSNDGVLLLSMNSTVWAYDMNTDTTLFEDQSISLRHFVDGLGLSNYYDPKLAYDPEMDRFILALLKDNEPSTSEVIMCFSSTNDPRDPWYVYNLPGNPLNNNRWTDFPTISVTHDKIYFSANLIIPNEPWQTGFDGSIIWEMDKFEAFSGDTTMQASLYDNITYDGDYLRNLHLVTGANGNTATQYLLSNRNFDVQNDSIFMVEIAEGSLNISALKADTPYGVPPNARQQDTDTSDATNGLQTNDARVLGAILIDDEIQFVSNTVNPNTGFSAIYHGVVSNIYNGPSVTANIIGDPVKDFGYPNIAWSGNEACDREVIIAFNHSSFTDFPGNSTVYCNNERQYSEVLEIKAGENYVNRLSSSYERWGDYYGLQRKYNTGEIYSFGYMVMVNNRNTGFLTQLYSPDTNRLVVKLEVENYELCNTTLKASTIGGVAPFEYSWNNETFTSDNQYIGGCTNDTVQCIVRDARGCIDTLNYIIPPNTNSSGSIYPNPTSDFAAIQFTIEEPQTVYLEIYNSNGQLVKRLETLPAKKGLNEYLFTMDPLSTGVYTVQLISNEEILKQEKIVKE